uniref:DAG protein, chloroplastic n=2 Tax=Anthurium amnicola TaxID=1678845 RepID=A0A1D1ZF28_9ARAE
MELLVPTTRPVQAPFPSLLPPLTSCRAAILPAVEAVAPGKASRSGLFPRIPRGVPYLVHASPQSPSQLPSFLSSSLAGAAAAAVSSTSPCTRWVVVMEKPPASVGSSRAEVIDHYVETLAKVLGNEKEAQMCIYDASWQTQFRFCCDIDGDISRELAVLPGVLSVKPDTDSEPVKSSSYSNSILSHLSRSEGHSPKFSPSGGNSNYWLVRMRKPGVEVVTKAQVVDYYAETLTKLLRNEKDAQVCIYHVSWEKYFGFCCQIDEECAHELADMPEVLHVRPDINFDSKNKDYGGDDILKKLELPDSPEKDHVPNIKTKRLFVTGLSFYTSEKTLRAAFEAFGELVEVKIIMDKISKRSKGYAFIEYTTEEAGSAALKEMNGKVLCDFLLHLQFLGFWWGKFTWYRLSHMQIINGWMIVVDAAKTNPPRYSKDR